jgi:hypothetical protein
MTLSDAEIIADCGRRLTEDEQMRAMGRGPDGEIVVRGQPPRTPSLVSTWCESWGWIKPPEPPAQPEAFIP